MPPNAVLVFINFLQRLRFLTWNHPNNALQNSPVAHYDCRQGVVSIWHTAPLLKQFLNRIMSARQYLINTLRASQIGLVRAISRCGCRVSQVKIGSYVPNTTRQTTL